jgi:hypothetical protein
MVPTLFERNQNMKTEPNERWELIKQKAGQYDTLDIEEKGQLLQIIQTDIKEELKTLDQKRAAIQKILGVEGGGEVGNGIVAKGKRERNPDLNPEDVLAFVKEKQSISKGDILQHFDVWQNSLENVLHKLKGKIRITKEGRKRMVSPV